MKNCANEQAGELLCVSFSYLTEYRLNLGANRLSTLPSDIGNLSRLVSLNIEANQLTDLPLSIGLCTGLSSLNILGNPIR